MTYAFSVGELKARARVCVCVCLRKAEAQEPVPPAPPSRRASPPLAASGAQLHPNSALLVPLLKIQLLVSTSKARPRLKIIWLEGAGWRIQALPKQMRLFFQIQGSTPGQAFHLPVAWL